MKLVDEKRSFVHRRHYMIKGKPLHIFSVESSIISLEFSSDIKSNDAWKIFRCHHWVCICILYRATISECWKIFAFFSHFIFTFSWKCILNYLDMYRKSVFHQCERYFRNSHAHSQSVCLSLLGILLYRKIRFNQILMLSFVYDARNMKSGEFSESFGIWATNFISFEFSQCF